MKKKILIISSILFLCVAIFLIFIFLINKNNDPSKNKIASTLGVWLWDDEADSKYLDFAFANGVDEIYFCSSKFDETSKTFIQNANAKNIKVFMLCGEYQWIENCTSLENKIAEFVEFNTNNPNTKFEGIHIDVEPHQHPDFDTNRTGLILKYIEFVHHITSTYPAVKFDFDIPAWLDDTITYDGKTQEAFKFVFDYANRVFVMSYRDSAEKIVAFAEDELLYAKQTNKTIFLCVETGSEEDKVTFETEGKNFMMSELEKLKSLVSQEYGVSIHHLKTWCDLKN